MPINRGLSRIILKVSLKFPIGKLCLSVAWPRRKVCAGGQRGICPAMHTARRGSGPWSLPPRPGPRPSALGPHSWQAALQSKSENFALTAQGLRLTNSCVLATWRSSEVRLRSFVIPRQSQHVKVDRRAGGGCTLRNCSLGFGRQFGEASWSVVGICSFLLTPVNPRGQLVLPVNPLANSWANRPTRTSQNADAIKIVICYLQSSQSYIRSRLARINCQI